MPLYSYAGAALLAISEIGMLAHVEPFWTWHTSIAWTAWILLVDGFVYARRGSSWLMTDRREFWFLAAVSVPLWVIFEAYNLLIHNWHYINLPQNIALRYFGYGWAFATISPAIFETSEAIGVLRVKRERGNGEIPLPSSLFPDVIVVLIGAAFLLWPILWPSPYLAAPVWLGFILLLDPINRRLGEESLLRDWRAGRTDRLINLCLSGFVCGVLWEFWNYWARAKWIYDVPIMQNVKIFEMPLPGFLGFPPFALECFTMYVFVRRLVWTGGRRRRIAV